MTAPSKTQPLISIVTPVLNGVKFLPETVNSVLAQRYENWEYTIIDAGSDDGSYERALEFARYEPRIRVIQRPAEPLYQSILYGLSEARGDLLAWLNADDLYTPWAFAALNDFFSGIPDAQWVTGLPGCWDEKGALKFVRPRGWHPRSLIRKGYFNLRALGFLQQESMFFSRSLFESLTKEEREQVQSMKLAGDFLLWKFFAERATLHTVPTVLGGFRRHGANQSVGRMDEYLAEVGEVGAWMPPARVGALARRIYDALAAMKTQRLVRQADEHMINNQQNRSS